MGGFLCCVGDSTLGVLSSGFIFGDCSEAFIVGVILFNGGGILFMGGGILDNDE